MQILTASSARKNQLRTCTEITVPPRSQSLCEVRIKNYLPSGVIGHCQGVDGWGTGGTCSPHFLDWGDSISDVPHFLKDCSLEFPYNFC